jgi:hypothetical protein
LNQLASFGNLPVAAELTLTEVEERNNWREKMTRIFDHYDRIEPPLVNTVESLLQQRVMVPCF